MLFHMRFQSFLAGFTFSEAENLVIDEAVSYTDHQQEFLSFKKLSYVSSIKLLVLCGS